jgi:hypothetical protein
LNNVVTISDDEQPQTTSRKRKGATNAAIPLKRALNVRTYNERSV